MNFEKNKQLYLILGSTFFNSIQYLSIYNNNHSQDFQNLDDSAKNHLSSQNI